MNQYINIYQPLNTWWFLDIAIKVKAHETRGAGEAYGSTDFIELSGKTSLLLNEMLVLSLPDGNWVIIA